jgi:glycosyltransferase involved in cell wall biosynthesis
VDCQFVQAGIGLVKCSVCGRSRKTTADPARLRMRCRAAGNTARAIAKPTAAAKPRASRPEPEPDWWPKDADGLQIPTNDMTPEDLPCPHRGEVLRENVLCDLCGMQGVLYTVYQCAKHGECSLVPRKKGGKLRDCFKCSIRHEAVAAAASSKTPLGTLPVVSGPVGQPVATAKQPVRVVFFSPGLLRGGAERWIVTLCKTWRTQVRATAVVLADWAGSEPDLVEELTRCGVVVRAGPHVSNSANSGSVVRSASLEWAARTALAEADVVISWGWGDVHTVLAKAGWTGPHVVVSHGACEWSEKLLAGPSHAATHLVAVSRAAAAAFPERLRDKVKILWNGIELDRIAPSRPRDVVRAEWGCGPDDDLIGYVGRLAVSKNPVAVAQAAAVLQQRPEFKGRTIRAVLIGDGTHREIVVPECRELCGDSLVLVDPPDHIGDAYAALDVMVLASPSEGMSLALIEAWAAGLPTVATPVGAVPELEAEFGRLTVRVPVGAEGNRIGEAVLEARAMSVFIDAQGIAWQHLSAGAMARRWAEFLAEVVG